MNKFSKTLIALVRSAVSDVPCRIGVLSPDEWMDVMALAERQGVLAIAFDGVQLLPKEQQPDIDNLMEWLGQTSYIEQSNEQYYGVVKEISDIYANDGIRTVVLKGLACSSWYSNPQHRNSGDFDCFLCGDFERGNELVVDNGGILDPCNYKHSEITYKGIMIENHRFCLGVRGDKKLKSLERHLQKLITERPAEEREYVKGTCIEIPCADFNALFLLAHTFRHFLDEGTNLKQLCDWAMFLRRDQKKVDWSSFYKWAEYLNMKRFACAITDFVVRYLGVHLDSDDIVTEDTYTDRILEDTFYTDQHIHNKGYSHIRKLFEIARAIVRNRWKYNEIYQKSAYVELINKSMGFVFERNPKI